MNLIKARENEILSKMKEVAKNRQLQPDQCTEELDYYFSCEICLSVVNNPRECGECNQLVCEQCIKGWLS